MRLMPLIVFIGAIFFSACSGLQVAGQLHAGRNALQTGRPQEAIAYLAPAAEAGPSYRLSYRAGESVLTYLGRAYYETGRDAEAQRALEKALERAPEDHLARIYLGLARLRGGSSDGRPQVDLAGRGKRAHELESDWQHLAQAR